MTVVQVRERARERENHSDDSALFVVILHSKLCQFRSRAVEQKVCMRLRCVFVNVGLTLTYKAKSAQGVGGGRGEGGGGGRKEG